SIIMHDTSIVSDTLQALHQMGVSLSIDDFGTGYSSLSYIQRFPLDRLKIDRSFVEDIMKSADDAAMIVSIIALAHSMKLQVLAEGVETKEQLEYLQKQGCDEVQGFYFSRPLPADEFEKLLSTSQK
ncbi:MAG: EAL domain-containing protein, partial [Gammaproteobacteria bacterium]|nr:EAL domain-containing protein [Gammaproteobacteria bacterium]